MEPTAEAATPARLTRAALRNLLSDYLEALVARDPSRVRVAPDYKFTENAEVLRLGEGLWRSAGEVRADTRLDFIDVVAGQAGSQLVLEEEGQGPVIFQIRIKVVSDLITEVETIAVRKGDLKYFDPDGMKPVPIFYEPVPQAQRMSRQRMRETVDRYIDLLKVGSFSACGTRLHRDMVRWENGVVTADYASLAARENGPKREAIPVRYPIFDEEYGLVYALLEFGRRDVTLCPFELFKVVNDEIAMLHIVIKPMKTQVWT